MLMMPELLGGHTSLHGCGNNSTYGDGWGLGRGGLLNGGGESALPSAPLFPEHWGTFRAARSSLRFSFMLVVVTAIARNQRC